MPKTVSPPESPSVLPSPLRRLRQARGLTMQQLADASGTSKSQIDKLERGARRLTTDWIVRLAHALGCDPSALLPDGARGAYGEAPVSEKQSLLPIRTLTSVRGGYRLAEGIVDRVARPSFLAHAADAYAFYMADDGMAPMYRQGQLLFVHPAKPPVPRQGVVLLLREGEVRVGALVALTDKACLLRRYGTDPAEETISREGVASVQTIVGTADL